ncbi:PIKK/TRRAP protein kinase Tra1 [Schizosaccharomyces cryophilus OY26]|uniref:PIKK/TRRAP protein kinase Tra1 n=1 Tax=Schizosaccharomyces cryophilus (strain OY26 / ATCC MYA-4695 / CBS 11777 / NBRC 106824 / NRRL Y48691) TaxID=653667 RepID=S9W3Z3_SCHCR|nr:PIKK/TRRAP protein kinase Tra1 [Schizosaccharomyces cryophilus OY26]EPY52670.1 PIKK/TRRAP protein kinase Tra1 [Schizosaccharomyces cryophilus OY26]
MGEDLRITLEDSFESLKTDNLDLGKKNDILASFNKEFPFSSAQNLSTIYASWIPFLLEFVQSFEVSFDSDSLENEVKRNALSLLQQCAHKDEFQPYAELCVTRLVWFIRAENDEIAIYCLKMIMDIFKSFKASIHGCAQSFFDLVVSLARKLPSTIPFCFPKSSTLSSSVDDHTLLFTSAAGSYLYKEALDLHQQMNHPSARDKKLQPALQSFRVFIECPVVIVLILQVLRQSATSNVQLLLPFLLDILQINVPIPDDLSGRVNEDISFDFIRAVKNKSAYRSVFMAQVKTLSFVAYILRTFPETFSNREIIPLVVVKLLRRCPYDMCFARKELLVASRHILSTNLRRLFIGVLDSLLEPNILLGKGVASRELLRPLAYSTLADLLHHIRNEVSSEQIRKAITIYSHNLHDPSLSIGLQTMGARLVLNMIDRIISLPNPADSISLLFFIFDAFIAKFHELNYKLQGRFQQQNEKAVQRKDGSAKFHIEEQLPSIISMEKDGSFLFKNLMLGLRALMYGLRMCKARSFEASNLHLNNIEKSTAIQETQIFKKLFIEVAKGLSFFRPDEVYWEMYYAGNEDNLDKPLTSTLPKNKDEKDCLEVFATIFIHLEPPLFIEIFETNLPMFFEQLKLNLTLFHIPQFLLSNESTSSRFLNVLLRFLLSKLGELGSSDERHGSVMLRLFRLSFVTVSLFAQKNETVLRPYVSEMVIKCMKFAPNSKNSINYYLLLRALFRGIGGGRFDSLYKEIMPLLHALLEAFNSLLASAKSQKERDLFTELCLTVPVRLSLLLPYLSYLMKPLVNSLKSGQELVNQGLRTFELFLDNLTPDFLDPIMAPIIDELMDALWGHLQPLPYSHQYSHNALRILGKLGGRNRKLLNKIHKLSVNSSSARDFTMLVDIRGTDQTQLLHYLNYVDPAVNMLTRQNLDIDIKRQSFNYLTTITRIFFHRTGDVDSITSRIKVSARQLLQSKVDFKRPYSFATNRGTGRDFFCKIDDNSVESLVLSRATYGLFIATSNEGLRESALQSLKVLAANILVYDLLYAVDLCKDGNNESLLYSRKEPVLSSHYFSHCLAKVMCEDDERVRNSVTYILNFMFEFASVLFDDSQKAYILPIFEVLLSDFRHKCYDCQWHHKHGGCLGLKVLIEQECSPLWLFDRQADILTALFFTLKDTTPEVPSICKTTVMDVLKCLFEKIYTTKDTKIAPGVLGHLVLELSNHNSVVRNSTRELLSLLSAVSSIPISELVSPFKERLLGPIFAKPLRALPFHIQIGHIDAVYYFIGLDDHLISLTDEVMRIIHETVALAGADDDALIGHNKASHFKNAAFLVRLRVVCINLLSSIICKFDLTDPQHVHLRGKIISVFFKSLYVKSNEVIEAAFAGLQYALKEDQKLPKELLQTGLRPILFNISDHKRLTVAGLEGLARLLSLLTNYFKVEIGRKLLDHLIALRDTINLREISKMPLASQTEMKIIQALINIFHLLPNNANQFMIDLLKCVLDIEMKLNRTCPNYFGIPLLKYINRYPHDAWDFFYARIDDSICTNFFIELLRLEESENLMLIVKERWSVFRSILTTEVPTSNNTRYSFALEVSCEIFTRDPSFFKEKNSFFKGLTNAVEIIGDLINNGGTITFITSWERVLIQLCDFLLKIYDHCIKDFDSGLDLLAAFQSIEYYLSNTLMITLTKHLQNSLAENFELKLRSLLFNFLSSKNSLQFKNALINDVLLQFFNQSKADVESCQAWFYSLYKFYLKDLSSKLGTSYDDGVSMGTLQIILFFLRNNYKVLEKFSEEIMSLCCALANSEDIIIKQLSIYSLSILSSVFSAPVFVPRLVYKALLKSSPVEVRHTVKSSFECIFSSMSSSNELSDHLVKLPLQMMKSQSQNISQLLNVLDFLSSHVSFFYSYRSNYISIIIDSLYKLGGIPNPNLEIRSLSLNLVKMLVTWDKTERFEQKTELFTNNQKRAILSFLFRFICLYSELYTEGLCKEAADVLEQLFSLKEWSNLGMKLTFFTKSIAHFDSTESNSIMYANSLKTLSIVIKTADDAWILENFNDLKVLLVQSLQNEHTIVQPPLSNFVSSVLSLPNVRPSLINAPGIAEIWSTVSEWTERQLLSGSQLDVALSCLKCCLSRKNASNNLLAAFMRSFHKVTKEALSLGAQAIPTPAMSMQPVSAIDEVNSVLMTMTDLGCSYVCDLNDQRRWFLSALVQIIEKSTNEKICSFIFNAVRNWVVNFQASIPTLKEKAALLLKMVSFESRFTSLNNSNLFSDYLYFIHDVFGMKEYEGSELLYRLEAVYLLGTRSLDSKIRDLFINTISSNLPKDLYSRFCKLLGVHHWDSLSNTYWLSQLNSFLIDCFEFDKKCVFFKKPKRFPKLSSYLPSESSKAEFGSEYDNLKTALLAYQVISDDYSGIQLSDIMIPISKMQVIDAEMAGALWEDLFNASFSSFTSEQVASASKAVTLILSKEYHIRLLGKVPSVLETFLNAILLSDKFIALPPQLLSFLSKNFGLHHQCILLLENALRNNPGFREDELLIYRNSCLDALSEVYYGLDEHDLYIGLWKRRSRYLQTEIATSYEQCYRWEKAQLVYEQAQINTCAGAIPYSPQENGFWHDHWIECAQKLNQWDVLLDLSKQEGCNELYVESAWRILDWNTDRDNIKKSVKTLSPLVSLRRHTSDALLSLTSGGRKSDSMNEFAKTIHEGMQFSLRRWQQLPKRVFQSHTTLLHHFQELAEMQEAYNIYTQLESTTIENLDAKLQDIKVVLQSWRERLPNIWDDINCWSDLVSWRKTVFKAINNVFLPLASTIQQASNVASNTNSTSYLYRGYHELAWIINRFAHVARVQHLPEVCINQLTKIYTLPNIEIQEAFLKLREQAKCHYEYPSEIHLGLEVINNTNLMYFRNPQKAEFFTLKGMFQNSLGEYDEANQAFATAVQIDLTLGKAWAEWGLYHDNLFNASPQETWRACNAVSCYLQAASLYSSSKAKKYLSRLLWLLSIDGPQGSISAVVSSFKSEIPVWNWISFIPQLLASLSHNEAPHTRAILIAIARTYPQALHFQLRTAYEDYTLLNKQQMAAIAKTSTSNGSTESLPTDTNNRDLNSGASISSSSNVTPINEGSMSSDMNGKQNHLNARIPSQITGDIMAILKTAYPLLALTTETMVDQIQSRLKSFPDEDAYRLIVALLNDGLQYITRLGVVTKNTPQLPMTKANIQRFAENVLPTPIRELFLKDFVEQDLSLLAYVDKLRVWKKRFVEILDQRPKCLHLEQCSLYLSEFQHQKFDEVEIPGQYLLDRDSNNDFVRLERFIPNVDLIRGHNICYKRLTMRGYDGILYPFALQYPATRHSRREERMHQLLRSINSILETKIEVRRRNITFDVPISIPLSSHMRILSDDDANVTVQKINDWYCEEHGMASDHPIRFFFNKLQSNLIQLKRGNKLNLENNSLEQKKHVYRQRALALRMQILDTIKDSIIPETIHYDYFGKVYNSYSDFWFFKRTFTVQYAYLLMITYIFNVGSRFPHKININRSSGSITSADLLPLMTSNQPTFNNPEAVPFRLTPPVQYLIGDIGIEGLLVGVLISFTQSFSSSDADIRQYLSLYIRDEVLWWHRQQKRSLPHGLQLFEMVRLNVELLSRRASGISQNVPDNLPITQTLIDLISQATNPKQLAQMDQLWQAWL